MTHRWKITEKYTNMCSNSHTRFMEILNMLLWYYFSLSGSRSKCIPDLLSLFKDISELKNELPDSVQLTDQFLPANIPQWTCQKDNAVPYGCFPDFERERERERGLERWRKSDRRYGLSLAHSYTHTHTFLHQLIPVFLFSLCSQELLPAHTHTQRAFYASDLSLTRTSHSTGMFHSRIFPSVRPEDFMTLMRDAWTLSLWKCDQFTKHDWWGQHTHISPS